MYALRVQLSVAQPIKIGVTIEHIWSMWKSRMTGNQCVMQVTKLAWVLTDMRAGHSTIADLYQVCSCPLPRTIQRAPIYQVSHSYKVRITDARSSYHWQPVPPNHRSISSFSGNIRSFASVLILVGTALLQLLGKRRNVVLPTCDSKIVQTM